MSDSSFDPYHRWLGIPPNEQPADSYRLLGLSRFEADLQVIRDAAERQIAHVRRNSLGRHLESAQKLLNELAAAKAVLMDPVERAAYDRRLHAQDRSEKQAEGASGTATVGAPPSVAAPPAPARTIVVSLDPGAWFAPLRAHPRIAVAGAVGGVAVLLLIVILVRPRASNHMPTPPPAAAAPTTPPLPAGIAPPADAATPESVPDSSRPPELAAIPPQTIDEGAHLRLPVMLRDGGAPNLHVRYRLGPGAPEGAHIDADSGLFAWSPTEAQGPGEYIVALEALTGEGGPAVTQTNLQIAVREANEPPVLRSVEDLQVAVGEVRRVQLVASDPDCPANGLRFSVLDPQPWMSLDASSGLMTVAPKAQQAGHDHLIMVRVTDDGTPPLTDDKTFLVHVPSRNPTRTETATAEEVDDSARPFGAQYRLRFPSGRGLASSNFEIRRVAIAETDRLSQMRMNGDPRVAVTWAGPTAIAALCSVNVADRKLEGVTVTFHEGADPVTIQAAPMAQFPRFGNQDYAQWLRAMYEYGRREAMAAKLRAVSAPRMLPMPEIPEMPEMPVPPGLWNVRPIPVPGAGLSRLDRCQPRLCANFAGGIKDGMLVTWHPDGTKEYFGEYAKGEPTGYSCLFQNDRLRLVLEYAANTLAAVHLVDANQVARTFPDVQQAQTDGIAGPLLDEILTVRSRVAAEEKSLCQELSAKKPSAKSTIPGLPQRDDPRPQLGSAPQKPNRTASKTPVALTGTWQCTSSRRVRIVEEGNEVHLTLISHDKLAAFELFGRRVEDEVQVKSCYLVLKEDRRRRQVPVGAKLKILDATHIELSSQRALPRPSLGGQHEYIASTEYYPGVFEKTAPAP